MAGILLERANARNLRIPVEIVAGVTAASAAAARMGAPLMLDYATISLSDLLVPWDRIVHRVKCVASADLVLALYNPRSHKRTKQLTEVREILLQHRAAETPIGLARAVGSQDESIALSTLGSFREQDVDMRSILIVGNSSTRVEQGWLLTPRGYYS
jgi:precorrin-3B C17-methyltransferase